jgi:hypothetical protein
MVACEYAGNLAGGAPLLVGIFRQIHAPALPGLLAPFYLALELEAEPYETGDHIMELQLIDEDGGILFRETLASQFRPRTDMRPNYSYFAGQITIRQPIQRPGPYRLDLHWNDQVLAQLRLDIVGPP